MKARLLWVLPDGQKVPFGNDRDDVHGKRFEAHFPTAYGSLIALFEYVRSEEFVGPGLARECVYFFECDVLTLGGG